MFVGFSILAAGAFISANSVVFAGLLLFGLDVGMCNVAMNLEGTEIEYHI